MTTRKTAKTRTPAQAVQSQGPFYVMADDCYERFDGTFCTMYFIARRGEGECNYLPSESYEEIASEVADMNAQFVAGTLQ